MRIALVGGIFGRSDWTSRPLGAPEISLFNGLVARGHDVEPLSHYSEALACLEEWDIVHVHHLSWGALTTAVQRVAGLAVPFVFTPHSLWLDAPTRRLALRLVGLAADANVALSPQETTGRWNRTSVVIPNGIQVPDLQADRVPAMPPFRLLYVGQLTPVKRIDRALRALSVLRQEMDARLTLIYHNDALLPELTELTRRLDLSPFVEFRGAVDRPQLWQEYVDHHCLVLTSQSEALPSVVSEASLLGLPVAAPQLGGIPSQIGDPSWLFPVQAHPSEIAGHIKAMFRDPERTVATARAHRHVAARDFAIEAMIDRHEELYHRLVERGARRRRRFASTPAERLTRFVISRRATNR